MLVLLILIFNALLAALLYYNFYQKRRNLPWGPTPLPLMGNLLTIIANPPGEKAFIEWRKKFGPVYTYWLGEQPIVCVAEYHTIMEMFQKNGDAYAGRFNIEELMLLLKGGNYGVVSTEGDLWRDQRRFALHVLRDFGLGKNLMQERVLTEVSTLLDKIKADVDAGMEEHSIIPYIDIAVGSIINVIVFGFRFQGTRESEFYELKRLMSRMMRNFGDTRMRVLTTKLKFWRLVPGFRRLYDELLETNRVLYKFYGDRIEEHKRELNQSGYDGPPTDYVDAFLREKERRDALEEPHFYSLSQLINMCSDLWIAGQETTTTTLAWGIVYLINCPEAQENMQEELDRVCGHDHVITVADRPQLPYTNAVVNEMQRMANLLPMNVPRRTSREVEVNGYVLPAGTAILPQISAVLYDPNVFPDPYKFDPSRYIDDTTGQLKRCDELIPFSVGKRQCLGEALARMELFLFTANLFHRYKLLPGKVPPSLVRISGGTAQCSPFVCRIVKRE